MLKQLLEIIAKQLINNRHVINNTHIKFGNKQLSSLFPRKDMLNIINKNCLCIEESIIKKIKIFLIINEKS